MGLRGTILLSVQTYIDYFPELSTNLHNHCNRERLQIIQSIKNNGLTSSRYGTDGIDLLQVITATLIAASGWIQLRFVAHVPATAGWTTKLKWDVEKSVERERDPTATDGHEGRMCHTSVPDSNNCIVTGHEGVVTGRQADDH